MLASLASLRQRTASVVKNCLDSWHVLPAMFVMSLMRQVFMMPLSPHALFPPEFPVADRVADENTKCVFCCNAFDTLHSVPCSVDEGAALAGK